MIVLVFLPLILLDVGLPARRHPGLGLQAGDRHQHRLVDASRSPASSRGIVVFIIGYFLTRWFQGWLDGSVMARGKVDTGVRNSIRLAVGYAGVALAALVGISAAGIDLSSFALVAGALSLGIGFGLQNVVSNFVSGLILLAERPFKVGDWIVAGDVTGTVKKISVRATEIETFQRQSVILPNSNLINSAVGNWTHRNKLGRVDIKVGVAYGSDVKRVHAMLLEIARSHPLVLKNPGALRAVRQFRPGGARIRDPRVPRRCPERQHRAERHPLCHPGGIQRRAHRDSVDAARRRRGKKPEAWPTDDDKIEAEFAERKAKAEAAAEAKRLAEGRARRQARSRQA